MGQIVRPVITQKKVSRHKSAFISASTAPNVASFLPFQTYFLFCVGMLGSLLPPEVRPIPFFFMGIPLSFYTLLAMLFALLMALDILPQVGPLKRFQRLADEAADCRIEDAVVSDSLGGADVAPDLTAFVLPLASLAVSLVVFSLIAGEIVIIPGMFFACIVSIVYPLIRGSVQFAELSNGFVGGFTEQVPIFLVLLFAFSFGDLLNKVGFSQQIVGIFSGAISGAVIPILVFAVACVISYTTGSLGSALVIMLPIAMPLAQATGASLLLTFGAVYSGCQWGDQTSPISDVLIENAGANEVDAIELSACFMPYRLVQLAVCAVLYVALGIILY